MNSARLMIWICLLSFTTSAWGQASLRESQAFKDVKVLNNFCWELLNVDDPEGVVSFTVPIDRWVLIRSTAEAQQGYLELRIMLDSSTQPMLVQTQGGKHEAMHWLKAGKHTLTLTRRGNGKMTNLIVRAIPTLQYALYGENCAIAPYGKYDWAFLQKHVLPHINVVISNRHVAPGPAHIGAWKTSGRRWIDEATAAWHLCERDAKGNLHFKGDPKTAADVIYKDWLARSWAVRHPMVDGLMIDEIINRNSSLYDTFREAGEKLYAHPKFAGKTFDLYVSGTKVYQDQAGKALVRMCVKGGGMIAYEWYLQEKPNLKEAQQKIDDFFDTRMAQWEQAMPGITPSIIATLAIETLPPENADRHPHVDVNVYMQMQMQKLATDPNFFALGGIQWYKSGYADEETIRLGGRLFRHYCLDGNTTPLTDDPYELPHLKNPDFTDGLNGWHNTGVKGAIVVKTYKGYGRLQGRWGSPMGDHFAWIHTNANRPNTISQKIKHLTPGRLYSLKMISSDYKNLIDGKSEKKQDAIRIQIDNVDVLADPSKTFQFTFPHSFGDKRDKFGPDKPYWMNLHRVIFRACTTTAKLTITGLPTQNNPDGEELMLNFVQVQPYLE